MHQGRLTTVSSGAAHIDGRVISADSFAGIVDAYTAQYDGEVLRTRAGREAAGAPVANLSLTGIDDDADR